MGLIDRPLAKMSLVQKAAYVAAAYALRRKKMPARLTDTYLDDPHVRSFGEPLPRKGKGANLQVV